MYTPASKRLTVDPIVDDSNENLKHWVLNAVPKNHTGFWEQSRIPWLKAQRDCSLVIVENGSRNEVSQPFIIIFQRRHRRTFPSSSFMNAGSIMTWLLRKKSSQKAFDTAGMANIEGQLMTGG